MACTEAYKEHIMYTFNGFCKVVIHNAAITAWHDQHRRHKRKISLEYITLSTMQLSLHGMTSTGGTKEKYPLNTSQKKSFTL